MRARNVTPRDNRPPGHPQPNKLFVTSQIFAKDGHWWMTIRLEKLTSEWTSPPVKLEATDRDAAMEECAIKTQRLLIILGGKLPGEDDDANK